MENEELKNIIQQEVRTILAEELEKERKVFERHIQMLDGRNIQTGRTVGTKIGTATDQLIGFYGVTPVNQPDTVADPSGGGTAGVDTPARDAIDAIIDRLQELGLIA